jgi:hypothetical protein
MIPPIIIAITFTDIQQIMKYFSSILGFFLMIFFPCILIIYSRKNLYSKNSEPGELNKAYFTKNSFVYTIGSFGAVIAGLIVYGFLYKDTKTCVAAQDQ